MSNKNNRPGISPADVLEQIAYEKICDPSRVQIWEFPG